MAKIVLSQIGEFEVKEGKRQITNRIKKAVENGSDFIIVTKIKTTFRGEIEEERFDINYNHMILYK